MLLSQLFIIPFIKPYKLKTGSPIFNHIEDYIEDYRYHYFRQTHATVLHANKYEYIYSDDVVTCNFDEPLSMYQIASVLHELGHSSLRNSQQGYLYLIYKAYIYAIAILFSGFIASLITIPSISFVLALTTAILGFIIYFLRIAIELLSSNFAIEYLRSKNHPQLDKYKKILRLFLLTYIFPI